MSKKKPAKPNANSRHAPPHPDGLISITPRCPRCGSTRTIAMYSQRITPGIEYQGTLCRAQKQGRRCNECGEGFPVVKIGAPIAKGAGGRATRSTPPPA